MTTNKPAVTPTTFETLLEKQFRQLVIETSQPFVKMKVDVLDLATPLFIVGPDNSFEVHYSEEVQNQLDEIEKLRLEAVESVVRRFKCQR